MNKIIILILALLLTGCTTTKPAIYGCPRVTIPPEPHYPLQDLKQGDSTATALKSCLASFSLCYDNTHEQLIPRLGKYQ